MALPPTPQNASNMTSHQHLSAIWSAIASGVTLYQPSSSRRQPEEYKEKNRSLWEKSGMTIRLMYAEDRSNGRYTHIFVDATGSETPPCRMGRGPSRRTSPVLVRGVRFAILLSSSAECPMHQHLHVCPGVLETQKRCHPLWPQQKERERVEARQRLFRERSGLVQRCCSAFFPWCTGAIFKRVGYKRVWGRWRKAQGAERQIELEAGGEVGARLGSRRARLGGQGVAVQQPAEAVRLPSMTVTVGGLSSTLSHANAANRDGDHG